jgi:hypothetical protein
MERQGTVFASIGCAGTVYIGRQHHAQEPELYELLASTFGDLLAGWEQGDTFYIGIQHGSGPVDMPERPKQQLRPPEERIEAGVESLIKLVQIARSLDLPPDAEDVKWQPSKQARQRFEVMAEHVLRGDARWRNEHPESEW